MNSNINILDKTKITQQLATLYNEIKHDGNGIQSQKIIDLIKKFDSKELVIGFAGHFSAGKSTMINRMINDNILPTSPIPTSANVVKVKNGPTSVKVYYREEPPIMYHDDYDIETIKSLSKNGELVKEIELSKPIKSLPNQIIVMDTPGIDSSNDADRIITEANLHIVDTIFYVMDYNHVQSEVNLRFLQELTRKEKELYIVINQIDKHEDKELTFASFKQSVQTALLNWDIKPRGIYYTSLKHDNHEFNQLEELQTLFETFKNDIVIKIEETIIKSTQVILDEHRQYLLNQNEARIEKLTDKIEEINKKYHFENINKKKFIIKTDLNQVAQEYRTELNSILKNAYLMPFENREKAKDFLESQKTNFKAGFLFTKKKTEELREERLRLFYDALMESTKTQLEWHVRELLLKTARNNDVIETELLSDLQNFKFSYDLTQLKKLVKPGAEVTGDYVLVYSNDVVADVKKEIKEISNLYLDNILSSIEQNDKLNSEEDHEQEFIQFLELKEELKDINSQVKDRSTFLSDILAGKEAFTEDLEFEVQEVIKKQESNVRLVKSLKDIKVPAFSANHGKEAEIPNKDTMSPLTDSEISVEHLLDKLEKTRSLIKNLKGFQSLSNDLKDKQLRLKDRHFTVALFGAFSAGKSSFANALLGTNILPVSPNPTTATINKISPPNSKNLHGTVRIQFKSEENLIQDVQHIISETPDNSNFLEVMDWLKTLDLKKIKDKYDVNNIAFLHALIEGYEVLSAKIGTQINISLEESAPFIADEKLACYVEWIEIYYDCSFTRQGITLVDTPGADSVNARHTDVAFQYIKDADAILFVTYYNHAFSRADREFLMQLGRVKDVFSLDKMFFIINASDLARDKEELQLVQNYVQDNLMKFGIKNPRMFSLSSKLALQEKLNQNKVSEVSGIQTFEDEFNYFIQKELTGIFIQSSLHDLERTKATVKRYIQSASLNEEEKVKQRIRFKDANEIAIEAIEAYNTKRLETSIKQEIKELTFYIHQRLFLRFTELFKEFFNPATIKSSGKKGKQETIQALKQLLVFMDHTLVHELQATSLRIELFMNDAIKEIGYETEKTDIYREYGLTFSDFGKLEFETPKFDFNLRKLDNSDFESIVSLYKNSKSFYELNDKDKMKDELQNYLSPIVKEMLESKELELWNNYSSQWTTIVMNTKEMMKTTVNEFFEGLIYNVSEEINIVQLKEVYQELISNM